MRIHLGIAVFVLLFSAWLRLTDVEWLLIVVAIALVLTGEMFNTVAELTVDLATAEQEPLAKRAKDVAAGAVFVTALTAAIIGLVVLGPPLWLRINQLLH